MLLIHGFLEKIHFFENFVPQIPEKYYVRTIPYVVPDAESKGRRSK
jgi:hypothetical protein